MSKIGILSLLKAIPIVFGRGAPTALEELTTYDLRLTTRRCNIYRRFVTFLAQLTELFAAFHIN